MPQWSRGEMDITRVFGTWIWGSSPYETASKVWAKHHSGNLKKVTQRQL